MVRRAEKQEYSKTRTLWEKVFQEDTKEFLDYYYEEVTAGNRIYIDDEEGNIVSMLHCNPYHIQMGQKEADVSYIVAVATEERCRHQGRMKQLLQSALQEAYERAEPFAFLMPVSEKIYRPFGFCTVGYQDVRSLGAPWGKKDSAWKCIPAEEEQFAELAAFSQAVLAEHCRVFSKRNRAYFLHMQKEQRAVNGGILLLYKKDVLSGYCFTGREDGTEIWELVTAGDYTGAVSVVTEYFKDAMPVKISGLLPGAQVDGMSQKEVSFRPLNMVRIVNLESFVQRMTAKYESETYLKIRDDFLPQNSGCYRLQLSPAGGRLEYLHPGASGYEEASAGREITIEAWTETVFGIRQAEGLHLAGFAPFHPVYLNELV